MSHSKKLALFSCVLLAGCGPKVEELGGTALTAAALFPLVSWALVWFVDSTWRKISGAPPRPAPDQGGLYGLALAHLTVSVCAAAGAPHESELDTIAILISNVAASHAAWSLVIWRFTRRPIMACLWASGIVLAPALLMLSGSDDTLVLGIVMWLYGGLYGAIPAAVGALLLLEAKLRGRVYDDDQDPTWGGLTDVFN